MNDNRRMADPILLTGTARSAATRTGPVHLVRHTPQRRAVTHSAVPYAAVMLPLAVAAFVDLPRDLPAGPVSFMGFLTIVQVFVVAIGLLTCQGYPRYFVLQVVPFGGFLVWAALRSSWQVPGIATVQNGLVYLLFGLAVTLGGTLAGTCPRLTDSLINKGVRFIDYVALSLVLLSILRDGLPTTNEAWLIGPRALALSGLIPLSWHLARWQYGYRGAGTRSVLWVAAILSSLSRTASAIALMYVAAAFTLQMLFSTRRMLLRFPLVAGAAVVLAAILYYLPLEERFLTGDTSIQVGDVALNASGRLDIWAAVIDSGARSPIIGQGLGSSNMAVEFLGPTVGHPHNDYLRVWHDLGYVGVILLVSAFMVWISTLGRAWLRARRRPDELVALQLAAYLALLALVLSAITDNALVYPFVMGPVGVVIGAGLGVSVSRRRL